MKKWIHSASDTDKFDYDQLIVNDMFTPSDNVTIDEAIDSVCYQVFQNYENEINDGELTFDEGVQIAVEHLDDPEIYELKCGEDYAREHVAEVLHEYLD